MVRFLWRRSILQFQLSSALGSFEINNPAAAGVMLAIASIGVPAGAITYRYAHHRFRIKHLVVIEFGIMAVGFIGMSLAPNYLWFLAAGLLNQFGAGMFLPTMLTWAVGPLSFDVRGRGTGIWQAVFALGQFATTLTFAWVLTQVGQDNYLASFMVFGVVAAVVSLGTLVLLPRTQLPAH